MDTLWANATMASNANDRLTSVIREQGRRISAFVRRQVRDPSEAEDIVQEVFAELLDTYSLMQPIERVGAWLIRVARNRIIDRFRKRSREVALTALPLENADEEEPQRELSELLAPAASGPDAQYLQALLGEALEEALNELPAEQRAVFMAHELEGKSFRELSGETGVSINTLLGRKHAAVQRLRETLHTIYEDLE
jgi:RNA polymerase sigma factor (sigma-70 family)